MENTIKYVLVRNKYGVDKKVSISKLNAKQLDFQLNNCNKTLHALTEKEQLLKLSNNRISRVKDAKAQETVANNVRELMKIEKTLSFLRRLKPVLEQEKHSRETLFSFINHEDMSPIEEMFLQVQGEDMYVE